MLSTSGNSIAARTRIGSPTLWMYSRGVYLSLLRKVRIILFLMKEFNVSPVTDMLVAVLNTCTKEELEEEDETPALPEPGPEEEVARRKQVLKNKILAVGRMSRVFALLRSVIFTCLNIYLTRFNSTVKSLAGHQCSKTYLARRSCHTVPWQLGRRRSRTL